MAGYLGTKAVFLSTTAASVTGNSTITGSVTAGSATVSGDLTVDTNTLYVDSTNNRVGVGTATPNANLDVASSNATIHLTDTDDTTYAEIRNNGGTFTIASDEGAAATNSSINFRVDGTERMRIDASGTLIINSTSKYGSEKLHVEGGSGGAILTSFDGANGASVGWRGKYNNTSGNAYYAYFTYNGSNTGSIISPNSSSTNYNTSSDYRLKEDWQPMTGASERVLALNPVNFAWKVDGSRVDGFLAHEAQAVVPEAVTGTKDAMRDEEYEVTPAVYEDVVIPAVLDTEGHEVEPERTEKRLVSEAIMGTRSVPDYQGIDQSKLVPLLTAALQEALTEIADLKARVTALETV